MSVLSMAIGFLFSSSDGRLHSYYYTLRKSLHNRAGNEAKRSSVELRSLVEWFSLFLELALWHPQLRLTVLAFCIIIVSFRSQNILDLLRTKSSWKLWPTPPHRCHASIRTLNGPLQGPVQVGVRSKYPGPSTAVMNLGLLGAAIYRAILIDQHSLRSHPNKAVDVVVCQTSWIDSGSRFIKLWPYPPQ